MKSSSCPQDLSAESFDQQLDAIESSLDHFMEQFEEGSTSDFSSVYQQVYSLLEQAQKQPPPPAGLDRLKNLGKRLAALTQEIHTEMSALEAGLSENTHRVRSLQAYAKQQKMGAPYK